MKPKKQSGFTLIELVMVIVILGILAAVALPRFVDLRDDAGRSAVAGVAGSLSAASALNKAARLANTSNGTAISACQDVSSALDGGLPPGYTITTTATIGTATVTDCVVSGGTAANNHTANFVAHGIS